MNVTSWPRDCQRKSSAWRLVFAIGAHHRMLLCTTLSLTIALSYVWAENEVTVIGRFGDWSVRKGPDAITGEMTCVAIYKDRFDIQLSPSGLFISLPRTAELKGYEFRVDAAPSGVRVPNQIEKQLNLIMIEGSDFLPLLSASRLQVRAATMLDDVVEEDVSLNGLTAAHKLLEGPECRGGL